MCLVSLVKFQNNPITTDGGAVIQSKSEIPALLHNGTTCLNSLVKKSE